MNYIKDGSAIILKLKIERRRSDNTLTSKIEAVRYLANVKEKGLLSLELTVPSKLITKEFRVELVNLLKDSKRSTDAITAQSSAENATSAVTTHTVIEGQTPVKLKIVEEEKGFTLDYDTKFKVNVDNTLLAALDKMGVSYKGNVNPALF